MASRVGATEPGRGNRSVVAQRGPGQRSVRILRRPRLARPQQHVDDRETDQQELQGSTGRRYGRPDLPAVAAKNEQPDDVFRGVEEGRGEREGGRDDAGHSQRPQIALPREVTGGKRRQGEKVP